MKYSDIVINCIGREYETRNFKFKDVNVTGPATLARIAKEMGVKRFIHISSINASDNPQVCIFSHYFKMKIEWQWRTQHASSMHLRHGTSLLSTP